MGAATEFEKLRKRRRIKRAFKRTTWMMLLSVLAAVGFLVWSLAYYLDFGSQMQNYLASMRPGGGFPIMLDDMHVEKLIPMGQDVAVVSPSGHYVYNQHGARLHTLLSGYSNPVTIGSGGKLLTYDNGGSRVRISTKTGLLYDLERSAKVLAADICETGAFALAESSKGSLGAVTAYSPKNQEMYHWETSQGYLYSLALDDQGSRFAAASVNAVDGVLSSRLHFHHFSATQEMGTAQLPDQLVLSMEWNEDGRLQVITDRQLHIYDAYGTELFVMDTPADITGFENSPQGVIYIASGDSRSPQGATITGYDSTLRQLGSWQSLRKIYSMQYFDGRLLILTDGQLYLADRHLVQVKARGSTEDMTAVCAVGGSIYAITGEGLIHQGL